MTAAACQARTSRRRPAFRLRHPGDIDHGYLAPRAPALPPSRAGSPGHPARVTLPGSPSAVSARLSACAPIAGTLPGRLRAGTGDLDCCAGQDSLAGAAVLESPGNGTLRMGAQVSGSPRPAGSTLACRRL
jgi:hypothetical protein